MSQVRRAFFIQFGGLIVAILVMVVLVRLFPVMEYILETQRKLGEMQFWGAVLYPLLYAIGNVLLLPGGVLAVGSGLFFGLWWGFLLNLVGNVLGAALAFGISRKLGRRRIEKRFFRNGKWAGLDAAITRHGWKIIFLSQVHPLFPTSLLNYLYGITRMRFRTCMLWVALAQAPGLFLYAYLGTLTQLGIRVLQQSNHPHPYEYAIWIGGLLLTLGVTAALGRLAFRLLAEAEKVNEESCPEKSASDTNREECQTLTDIVDIAPRESKVGRVF